MNTSILEITENDYCIKLNKETFDLSLVRQLVKRIQAEAFFFKKEMEEEDILSKRSKREELEGYDCLDDK
ncbi:hypothetical protein [Pedobacter sp. MW01-1-1]|uniref:hypothetical protein n=1 Tax=Pedobacter sp. MW01-1-1 TaxID=3383027 RepID=UPI003FEFE4F8